MKSAINRFLNHSKSGSALVVLLVIASLLIFTLETEYEDTRILNSLGLGIASVFGVEYVLRIWVANIDKPATGRLNYLKSFEGLVDLFAFLPALLFAGAGASVVLRILRVLRLAQLLKIGALTRGIVRIRRAMSACKSELAVSAFISLGLIFLGAVLIYLVEGESQPDAFGSIPRALWWSMATLTTVGYGDVYPITVLGKVVAFIMAIVGIGAVALPAGIIASAFMDLPEE